MRKFVQERLKTGVFRGEPSEAGTISGRRRGSYALLSAAQYDGCEPNQARHEVRTSRLYKAVGGHTLADRTRSRQEFMCATQR